MSMNYGKRLNDGFLIVAAIPSIKLNKPLFKGATGTACRFYKIGTQFAYSLVRREISGKEGRNLRNIILASHGSLAEGMLSAVRMIVGNTQGIAAYGLDAYKTPQDIYQLLKEQIEQNQDQEYILLCDINGGSVHNQLMHLCIFPKVYLMTGMTLSVVLELLLTQDHGNTEELLRKTMENARKNILLFNYQSVKSEIDKGIEDDKLW